jgi:hypothetical protein
MQLSDEIEAVWEICENSGPTRDEFPYMLVCHRQKNADMGFGCKTITEAKAKLAALATNFDKDGFKVTLA